MEGFYLQKKIGSKQIQGHLTQFQPEVQLFPLQEIFGYTKCPEVDILGQKAGNEKKKLDDIDHNI